MAGGGVGEAMLISAAVGAGTGAAGSAISGGDPLKGALLGAATGAVTGGAMGAFSGGASAGATAAETATTEAAKTAATTGTTAATTSVPGAIPGYAASAPAVAPPVPGPGSVPGPVPGAIPGYSAAPNPVTPPPPTPPSNFANFSNLSNTQLATVGGGTALQSMMAADRNRYGVPSQQAYNGPLSKFNYDPNTYKPQPYPVQRYAEGGIAALADGGLGGNMNYPQAQMDKTQYATPSQMPTSAQVMASDYEPKTNAYTGVQSPIGMKSGGIAGLLKGQGDGMSDSIHATIANRQPARLADGEFVVPADVVSHLGNGSTDAGAKHLYSMMDKVRNARTGTKKQGKQIKAGGYLPA
jgi:hypothetical protein